MSFEVLFMHRAKIKSFFTSQIAFELGLWLAGCFFWCWFLLYGNPQFSAYDWPITYQRFAVLKTAFEQNIFPFYASLFLEELPSKVFFLKTDRFLADINLTWSPQILSLSFLSVRGFLLTHLLFLYSVGFLGFLALVRKIQMSRFEIFTSFSIYYLCGFFTSAISTGQIVDGGYFFWSWILFFSWRIFELAEPAVAIQDKRKIWRTVCFLALMSMLVCMQGSFHYYYHTLLFMGLCLCCGRRASPFFSAALLFSLILGAFRIIPSFFFSGYVGPEVMRGVNGGLGGWYPLMNDALHQPLIPFPLIPAYWLSGLAEALTVIRDVRYIGSYWNGREYMYLAEFGAFDYFIGFGAFILIVIGIFWLLKNYKIDWRWKRSHVKIIMVASVFLIFSVGLIYGRLFNLFLSPVFHLPVPERVPSRMLIAPLLILVVSGAYGFDKWVGALSSLSRRVTVKSLFLFIILLELFAHASLWRVSHVETIAMPNSILYAGSPFEKSLSADAKIFDRPLEVGYRNSLVEGGIVSAFGLFVVMAILLVQRRKVVVVEGRTTLKGEK